MIAFDMSLRNSFLLTTSLVLFGLLTTSTPAIAEGAAESSATKMPVVAELFTSQSCSSCPAAERLFNDLADQEGVIAIQWHVDYWDNLVHGRAGKWKDPFSSAANTQRQRNYNYALRGTGSVYTPQAVIGGIMETTGSRARGVTRMINAAPPADAYVQIEKGHQGYNIKVSPLNETSDINAEAMVVTLLSESATDIRGGENKGLSVKGRNIAVDTEMLGEWSGKEKTYQAAQMSEGYSCAVIVQDRDKGKILGASYCPN